MRELPFKFDRETVYAITEYDSFDEYYDEEKDEYVTLTYEEADERATKIREQFDIIVKGDRDNSIQYWVFRHKDTDRLFRFDASYDSWNGTHIDNIEESDVREVKAVDRVVRFYEPI